MDFLYNLLKEAHIHILNLDQLQLQRNRKAIPGRRCIFFIEEKWILYLCDYTN